RARWLERIGDADAHREIASNLACLYTVDREEAGESAATGWLRIAAWNIERGRNPSAIAEQIARTGAGVALLSEVDVGMARTDNLDVAREIGSRLGAGSAYAVEYVELGLGKEADLQGIG